MATPLHTARGAWIEASDCDLEEFRTEVSRQTELADYPLASDVRAGVLVYSAETMAAADRRALQPELIRALAD
ncbi:MAG: hypothetical protein QOJ28_1422, partial [Mycobacterium sp.]|nr:hypothetical protein [Mycobacterium sp.]